MKSKKPNDTVDIENGSYGFSKLSPTNYLFIYPCLKSWYTYEYSSPVGANPNIPSKSIMPVIWSAN